MNDFTMKLACTMVTLNIGRNYPLHLLKSEWAQLNDVEREQVSRYAKAQKVDLKIIEDRR